jgi:hypothetical protein
MVDTHRLCGRMSNPSRICTCTIAAAHSRMQGRVDDLSARNRGLTQQKHSRSRSKPDARFQAVEFGLAFSLLVQVRLRLCNAPSRFRIGSHLS